MTLTKQEAYDKYQNSNTDGTRIALRDTRALHDDFVSFIETYTPPSSNPIVTKQEFLDNLLTRTFHLYWAAYLFPPPYGMGNPATFAFRRNSNGNYDMTLYSLTDVHLTYSFDPTTYVLHSNSFQFQDVDVNGNTRQVIVKKTSQRTVNGNEIWNHQYMVNSKLLWNYYMVNFALN